MWTPSLIVLHNYTKTLTLIFIQSEADFFILQFDESALLQTGIFQELLHPPSLSLSVLPAPLLLFWEQERGLRSKQRVINLDS